jgi:hypothetical protein
MLARTPTTAEIFKYYALENSFDLTPHNLLVCHIAFERICGEEKEKTI